MDFIFIDINQLNPLYPGTMNPVNDEIIRELLKDPIVF